MRHSIPVDVIRAPAEMQTAVGQTSVVVVDKNQRIVMLSPSARRLFGCLEDEPVHGDLARFIPDWPHINGDKSKTVASSDVQGSIVNGVRVDGEPFVTRLWAYPMEAAIGVGMQDHVCLVLRTPQQDDCASCQLDAFRHSMLALFDLAPVPTWVTEGERVVFANHACMALFGVSDPQDIVGKSMYTLLHHASHDAVRLALADVLCRNERVSTMTERIQRPDGTHRDVFIAMAALPDHGGTTAQMAITDITTQTQEFEEMERSQKRMRALSNELINAREEERRRIARELHDELGQRLAALKMELSSLVPNLKRRAQDGQIVAMIQMVDETVESVRRMATELRPLMLDDLGLVPAIETLVREFERRTGIGISLNVDEGVHAVSEPVAIATYRVVQEALTNVFRHAQASSAKVDICFEGQALRISVQDNGKGFAEQSLVKNGSNGLTGMRERAHLIGGQMQIAASDLGGAAVTVWLPIAPSHDETNDRFVLKEAPHA